MKNIKNLRNRITVLIIVALFLHILMPLSTLAQEEATPSSIDEMFEEDEDITEKDFSYKEEQEEFEEENEFNIDKILSKTEEATMSNADENFEENENKEENFSVENEEPEEEIISYIEATKSNTEEVFIETEEATMSNINEATSSEAEEVFNNSFITTDILIGTWSVDGITSFHFDVDGNGTMILPEQRYSFKYIIEENKLILNFEDKRIKEIIFIASIKDEELILEKTEEKETTKFILKKVIIFEIK